MKLIASSAYWLQPKQRAKVAGASLRLYNPNPFFLRCVEAEATRAPQLSRYTFTYLATLFCCYLRCMERVYLRALPCMGCLCAASTTAPSIMLDEHLKRHHGNTPISKRRELLALYEDFHRLPPAEVTQPAPCGLPIDALGPAQCEGLRKGCRCLVTGLYSMKKLFYTLDEFIYVVVLCSRSFQQFLECRRSTEGSTEGHHTDWALAHHTLSLVIYVCKQFIIVTSKL